MARSRANGHHSITRRKGIFRLLPPNPQWHIQLTGFGTHVIRDEDGADPLRTADPVSRLRNITLAASAPTLREALFLVLHRFEHIHDGWHRDNDLCALAWTAIYESRPLLSEELRLSDEGGQVHLDFDEAA